MSHPHPNSLEILVEFELWLYLFLIIAAVLSMQSRLGGSHPRMAKGKGYRFLWYIMWYLAYLGMAAGIFGYVAAAVSSFLKRDDYAINHSGEIIGTWVMIIVSFQMTKWLDILSCRYKITLGTIAMSVATGGSLIVVAVFGYVQEVWLLGISFTISGLLFLGGVTWYLATHMKDNNDYLGMRSSSSSRSLVRDQ